MPDNEEMKSIAEQANAIIAEARQGCKDRGEIEPGVKRGKMHFIQENGVCVCGKIDLSKYRMR